MPAHAKALRAVANSEAGQKIQKKIQKASPLANFVSGYFIATAIIALGILIGILGYTLDNGKTFKSSENAQCYSAETEINQYRIVLDVKGYNVKGSYPESINEFGQSTEWLNTGLITTGSDIEIVVDGSWYPWGISSTAKIPYLEKIYTSDSKAASSFKGSASLWEVNERPEECSFNTDLQYLPAKKPTEYENDKRKNYLNRYSSSESSMVNVDDQIEYISNVHCLDPPLCTNLRDPDNKKFSACMISDGHGVYVKIGKDTNYAYHIAKYEIDAYEKTIDDNVEQVALYKTSTGKNFYIPFNLPTKIYDQSYDTSKPRDIARLNDRLVNANNINTKHISLAEEYSCSDPSADILSRNLVNETCLPIAGKEIYIALNDIYYGDNAGAIDVIIRGGVQSVSGPSYTSGLTGRPNNASITQLIAFFMFDPLFGKQDSTNLQDGRLIDISNKNDGIIIELRNRILSNFYFQTMKILLIILMITLYGYKILIGNQKIDIQDLVKRSAQIAIVFWGTDPSNYALIDDILIPIFFQAITGVGGILMQAAFSVAGFSITVSNPFQAFDIILSYMFSEVIGYKILAMFIGNPIFWITSLILFTLMIIFVIAMAKTMMIAILGISFVGLTITFLPFVILCMLVDRTKDYFYSWIQEMEKEILQTVFFLFVMMIFFCIGLGFFRGIFDFAICWREIFKLSIFYIINISFYGWKSIEDLSVLSYVTNLLGFGIITFAVLNSEKFLSDIAKLFGGKGLFSSGASLLGDLLDTTVFNNPFVPKVIGGRAKQLYQDPFNAMKGTISSIGEAASGGRRKSAEDSNRGKSSSASPNNAKTKSGGAGGLGKLGGAGGLGKLGGAGGLGKLGGAGGLGKLGGAGGLGKLGGAGGLGKLGGAGGLGKLGGAGGLGKLGGAGGLGKLGGAGGLGKLGGAGGLGKLGGAGGLGKLGGAGNNITTPYAGGLPSSMSPNKLGHSEFQMKSMFDDKFGNDLSFASDLNKSFGNQGAFNDLNMILNKQNPTQLIGRSLSSSLSYRFGGVGGSQPSYSSVSVFNDKGKILSSLSYRFGGVGGSQSSYSSTPVFNDKGKILSSSYRFGGVGGSQSSYSSVSIFNDKGKILSSSYRFGGVGGSQPSYSSVSVFNDKGKILPSSYRFGGVGGSQSSYSSVSVSSKRKSKDGLDLERILSNKVTSKDTGFSNLENYDKGHKTASSRGIENAIGSGQGRRAKLWDKLSDEKPDDIDVSRGIENAIGSGQGRRAKLWDKLSDEKPDDIDVSRGIENAIGSGQGRRAKLWDKLSDEKPDDIDVSRGIENAIGSGQGRRAKLWDKLSDEKPDDIDVSRGIENAIGSGQGRRAKLWDELSDEKPDDIDVSRGIENAIGSGQGRRAKLWDKLSDEKPDDIDVSRGIENAIGSGQGRRAKLWDELSDEKPDDIDVSRGIEDAVNPDDIDVPRDVKDAVNPDVGLSEEEMELLEKERNEFYENSEFVLDDQVLNNINPEDLGPVREIIDEIQYELDNDINLIGEENIDQLYDQLNQSFDESLSDNDLYEEILNKQNEEYEEREREKQEERDKIDEEYEEREREKQEERDKTDEEYAERERERQEERDKIDEEYEDQFSASGQDIEFDSGMNIEDDSKDFQSDLSGDLDTEVLGEKKDQGEKKNADYVKAQAEEMAKQALISKVKRNKILLKEHTHKLMAEIDLLSQSDSSGPKTQDKIANIVGTTAEIMELASDSGIRIEFQELQGDKFASEKSYKDDALSNMSKQAEVVSMLFNAKATKVISGKTKK